MIVGGFSNMRYFIVRQFFKQGARLVSYNHFHSAKVCVCVRPQGHK